MSEASDTVEIRNSQSPMAFLSIAIKIGLGLLLLVGFVAALVKNAAPERQLTLLALAFVGFAFGFWELWMAFDRKVKVVLSPEGLCDYRARGGALLPWSQLRMAAVVPGSGRGVHLTNAAGDHIQVDISSLDISAREFMRLIKRYAPQAELRGLMTDL
jgi:hypothetical protein